MNIAKIKGVDDKFELASGYGLRVGLFCCGCRNKCKGCFNPDLQDFEYGRKFTDKDMRDIIEVSNQDWVSGLTLLGGDPYEKENRETIKEICNKYKSVYPNKTIWCYTGYYFEDIYRDDMDFIENIDVLVDGVFLEKYSDLSLGFCGSYNQRIIDVKGSNDKVIRVLRDCYYGHLRPSIEKESFSKVKKLLSKTSVTRIEYTSGLM